MLIERRHRITFRERLEAEVIATAQQLLDESPIWGIEQQAQLRVLTRLAEALATKNPTLIRRLAPDKP